MNLQYKTGSVWHKSFLTMDRPSRARQPSSRWSQRHTLDDFLDAEEADYKFALKLQKKQETEAKKQKRVQAKKRKRKKERRKVNRAKRTALLIERGCTLHNATFSDGRTVVFKKMRPKYPNTRRMVIAMLGEGYAVKFIACAVRKREKCLMSTAIQRVIDIKFSNQVLHK